MFISKDVKVGGAAWIWPVAMWVAKMREVVALFSRYNISYKYKPSLDDFSKFPLKTL